MEKRRKIVSLIAILAVAVLIGTLVYAQFTANQPVPFSIKIMGSQSFQVYTDAALTQPYVAGTQLSYGEVMSTATVAKLTGGITALYCENTGQMALQVNFNSTALPAGITWNTQYSTNGFTTYAPLAPNQVITVPAGGQLDIGFDLALSNPAFGSYSWTTTIYALGS